MLRGIGQHVAWYRTTCCVVSDNMLRGIGQHALQPRLETEFSSNIKHKHILLVTEVLEEDLIINISNKL
jgi:hypothetical protein